MHISKLKPKNRVAAPLMILIVKFVCHKKRAIKTDKDKSAYHALKNQLKPNTYISLKISENESFPSLNSHKEC